MSFRTINPATGEVVKEFSLQWDEQVFTALCNADKRYHEDWKHRSVASRARIVGRSGTNMQDTPRSRWARSSA
jgi:succinate-semialdehyde dehydrogenase/glutarate-semialdehyde dehydrogenase